MSIILGYSNSDPEHNVINYQYKNVIIDRLENVLTNLKVNVIRTQGDENNKEVLWIRDIFFIIDKTCIICNLTTKDSINKNRAQEYKTIINKLISSYKIEFLPEEIRLEGGDVIQNDNDIFVGVNERTNKKAISHLQYLFPTKNIIPIRHNDMHLDCVFSVVKNNVILYSRRRTHASDIQQLNCYGSIGYDCVNIDDEHDGILATNFLIINDNIIHNQREKENSTVIRLLRDLGYTIHYVDIGDLWKEGGGIRCLTQWFTKLEKQLIY